MDKVITKHTPAPWRIGGQKILAHPLTKRHMTTQVIETSLGEIEVLDQTNEPDYNIILMTSAPKMLEALMDCQQALAHAIHRLKDDGSFLTSIALKGAEDKARTIIKEATGGK